MPSRYVVLNQGRLVVELWWGNVSNQEIAAHEAGQLRDPRIVPGAVAIADLRPASFPREEELDVRAIAAAYEHADNVTRFSRYALLTDTSETFFVSRAIEEEMAPFGVRVVIFASLSTACTWLGCDAAQIEAALEGLRE